MQYSFYLILLIVTVVVELIMIRFIDKRSSKKNQLSKYFKYSLFCMMGWCISLIVQIFVINFISPDYALFVDYFVYIFIALAPVALFFVSISFARKNDENLNKKYGYLFIVPFITILILWTNTIHGLFYKVYSINPADTVFGYYFYIHSIYTYGLFVVDLYIMLRNSIRNTGAFSKQSFLIAFGFSIPLVVNLLGMTVFKMNIYVTPISFVFSFGFIAFAIFKYDFLNISPIALKRIVNQMSDLYVVLNKDYQISDCNVPFEKVFNVKKEKIIGKSLLDLNFDKKIVIKNKKFGTYLDLVQTNKKVYTIDASLKDNSKYFSIEMSGIYSQNYLVGILILFKDTTQHILDMETLKQNQDTLMERERLASLGQMVGRYCPQLKNSYHVYCRCYEWIRGFN